MSALNSQYDDSNEYQAMSDHFHKVAPDFDESLSELVDGDEATFQLLQSALYDPTTPYGTLSWIFGSSEY